MAEQNLFVPQGTDFSTSIDLTADDGTGINVAGYIFNGVVRKNFYSANAAANLVITVTDTANGNATVGLSAANSAALEYGRYIYSIHFTNTSNQTYLLLEGDFNILPSVLEQQPLPKV